MDHCGIGGAFAAVSAPQAPAGARRTAERHLGHGVAERQRQSCALGNRDAKLLEERLAHRANPDTARIVLTSRSGVVPA